MMPPDVERLQAQAERVTTPSAVGDLVWHMWGEGKPLVLFHGGSGSWTHWVRNIDALVAAGRRVMAPDLPSFGDSAAAPAGADADALPPLLEQGLQLLLGDTPVDVAGFSFGGLTAGLYAASYPARFSRLILIGAPGLNKMLPRPVALKSWRGVPDGPELEQIHRHNLATLLLHHPASINAETVALHRDNQLRDRMPGRRLARTTALRDALPATHCPVWAIYGAEDAIYKGSADTMPEALRQAPGFQSLTVIPDGGHWIAYERPDAFNAALLAALA